MTEEEKEALVQEIKETMKEEMKETFTEERKKYIESTEKFMQILANSLTREQDKNEITIKTVKEISKHYNTKEAIIVIALLIFLLILYSL